MSDFDRALPFVLSMEGGYVNDPDDRGGATSHGVTQATYDSYRKGRGQPTRDVKDITPQEVGDCYNSMYWHDSGASTLPWPLSLAVFDAGVNHGVGRARKMLQEALGVEPDGIIGPKTRAAIEACDPDETTDELLWIRVDFYYRISKGDQIKFLRGWLRRLLHLRKEAA